MFAHEFRLLDGVFLDGDTLAATLESICRSMGTWVGMFGGWYPG
jgi:hypothetical protein